MIDKLRKQENIEQQKAKYSRINAKTIGEIIGEHLYPRQKAKQDLQKYEQKNTTNIRSRKHAPKMSKYSSRIKQNP